MEKKFFFVLLGIAWDCKVEIRINEFFKMMRHFYPVEFSAGDVGEKFFGGARFFESSDIVESDIPFVFIQAFESMGESSELAVALDNKNFFLKIFVSKLALARPPMPEPMTMIS